MHTTVFLNTFKEELHLSDAEAACCLILMDMTSGETSTLCCGKLSPLRQAQEGTRYCLTDHKTHLCNATPQAEVPERLSLSPTMILPIGSLVLPQYWQPAERPQPADHSIPLCQISVASCSGLQEV